MSFNEIALLMLFAGKTTKNVNQSVRPSTINVIQKPLDNPLETPITTHYSTLIKDAFKEVVDLNIPSTTVGYHPLYQSLGYEAVYKAIKAGEIVPVTNTVTSVGHLSALSGSGLVTDVNKITSLLSAYQQYHDLRIRDENLASTATRVTTSGTVINLE